MARNKPERIWVTRHTPNKEPKFHMALSIDGDGKETRAPLTIDKMG